MTILVTGGGGILAQALRKHLPNAVYLPVSKLDVRDEEAVHNAFVQYKPNIVFHFGAETNANVDPNHLIAVNTVGTQYIAKYAQFFGSYLIYTSTNYVYPSISGNYSEYTILHPINTYAWTKYGGELAVQTVDKHLIVRGSWFGPQWKPMFGIYDAYTSKAPVATIANQLIALIQVRATGIVNVGGLRRSFYEIVQDVNPEAGRIALAKTDLFYRVPRDSSVNLSRLRTLTGLL